MKAEKHCALRHLRPHAVQRAQRRAQAFVFQRAQRAQIKPPLRRLPRQRRDIRGPVAQPAGAQRVLRRARQPLRRWKREERAFAVLAPFAEALAQRLRRRPNARNVVILRNDKRRERLPCVLTQNAQTAAVAVRRGQERVLPRDARADGGIVRVEIEIAAPEGFKRRLFAGKGERPLPRRPHRHAPVPCREPHRAAVQLLPAEQLPAARDQQRIEIPDCANHHASCAFPPFAAASCSRKSSSCSRTESHSAFTGVKTALSATGATR